MNAMMQLLDPYRSSVVVVALGFASTAASCPSGRTHSNSPSAQGCPALRETVKQLVTAVEQRDLPGLTALMHPSGRMQLALPDRPTSDTAKDFLSFHREFFAAPSWTMKHHILELECGDKLGHAYVEAVYHEPDRKGKPYYNHIAITYLFDKVEKQWYPIVDHASWIEQGSAPPKIQARP